MHKPYRVTYLFHKLHYSIDLPELHACHYRMALINAKPATR